MELHEKITELRKQKNITQAELAQAIYVSRTAVSKWEAGRGYPNIDSLKAIAHFFGITVDELLSNQELLTIAEQDTKQQKTRFRDIGFGLSDTSVALLLFLPLFGQKINQAMQSIPLLSLYAVAPYLKVLYWIFLVSLVVLGIAALALQTCEQRFWVQNKHRISAGIHTAAVVLLIISRQPYAAVFLLGILVIKFFIWFKTA